jgi:hypothetical protein
MPSSDQRTLHEPNTEGEGKVTPFNVGLASRPDQAARVESGESRRFRALHPPLHPASGGPRTNTKGEDR